MSLISQNGVTVAPQNTQTQFSESFKTYDTAGTWTQSVGTGDIVQLDGNAAAASYLVISKDPLTSGSESTVVTQAAFSGPLETAVGLGISQRVLGQETAIELISTDTPLSTVADLALSSIGSNGTTLYINTVNPHNLSVGQRIGVYGVTSDSRMNYPSLVVSAVVSTTQVYATAGPGGTVTSLTVGPYSTQGFLYVRPALGYAVEGISEIFENTSATNASFYVRADSGDVYASGTISGNHSVTIGSTASVALVAASYTYAYVPTNEYRFLLQPDRVNFYDAAVDTTNQPSARINRTTVVPSPTKTYKLRVRVTNNKGLTVPTAKIVSAAKAGTTTATITTASAHNLTVNDFVYITGIRNGTDFIPITTAVQVASVPTSTTFTLVYGGTSATVTSYGGFVARAQGGNLPAGFSGAGAGAAVQSAAVTATELTLVSSSATVGVSVGDYVNVYGCREATAGADLGVDGVYKVANIATTTITLIPIGGTILPTAFTTTNCGGAVIRRSDIRISYARINQYLRERVEILNKSDAFSGVPVTPNGGNISTITTVTTVSGASLALNAIVADAASGTITTTANGATITPTSGAVSQEFNIIVTGVSGTTPTLDYVLQESDDTGTNWYDVYHFPRITATGQYRSPLITLTGHRVRLNPTITGTSASFTRSLNRLQSHAVAPLQRQFFDRALVINTISSVTAGTFFIDGCRALAVMVSMGAVTTTAPVLVLEISPDNTNWVQVGADITTAANTNNLLTVVDQLGRFARIRVKTAGSGATLNFIMIKGSA